MSNLSQAVVTESAYLTLHYRLAAGTDTIVSTFENTPATLQLGSGQLAPFLEARLLGLAEGTRQTFELSPSDAFGAHNPDLVRRVSRASLSASGADPDYQIGDLLEFTTPEGMGFAGVLREVGPEDALIDLNHPLAGRTVYFEVQIVGIL